MRNLDRTHPGGYIREGMMGAWCIDIDMVHRQVRGRG